MKRISISFLILFLFFSCTNDRESSPVYIGSEENKALGFPFCEAVIYDDIIYVSGQVGEVLGTGELVPGGITPETNQAMMNIKNVLEKNGSSMEEIIKCTCMLADIAEWGEMSKAYVKFFPNHMPARSAFGTTGLSLGARVEIECMAAVK